MARASMSCAKCAINQICHKGHTECLAIRRMARRVKRLEWFVCHGSLADISNEAHRIAKRGAKK